MVKSDASTAPLQQIIDNCGYTDAYGIHFCHYCSGWHRDSVDKVTHEPKCPVALVKLYLGIK